ncbi:MAG TPA: hypothetical protein G4O09_00460 [Dehalococcoidia bacterium]|nr:hypothetical protein [Dehalococcoidia bacterium]
MLATRNPIDIGLNIQQVLKTIGYHGNCTPPARTMSLVDEYLENFHNLVEPAYSYVIRDVEWVQGPISFIRDAVIFKSQVIARLLEQCQKVVVFAVTIGNHLEEMVNQLAEDGLILQATVLDAIGSSAVEKLAEFVETSIREASGAQDLSTSRRFSPGYCDWNIGQQRMLFWALNGDTADIRLTRTCLMIPQKSISGIIGIGPGNSALESYNPCRTCKKRHCPGRR